MFIDLENAVRYEFLSRLREPVGDGLRPVHVVRGEGTSVYSRVLTP